MCGWSFSGVRKLRDNFKPAFVERGRRTIVRRRDTRGFDAYETVDSSARCEKKTTEGSRGEIEQDKDETRGNRFVLPHISFAVSKAGKKLASPNGAMAAARPGSL
jgi:hypothetical protein